MLGSIILWAEEELPPGWIECNGKNDTPDLRDHVLDSFDTQSGTYEWRIRYIIKVGKTDKGTGTYEVNSRKNKIEKFKSIDRNMVEQMYNNYISKNSGFSFKKESPEKDDEKSRSPSPDERPYSPDEIPSAHIEEESSETGEEFDEISPPNPENREFMRDLRESRESRDSRDMRDLRDLRDLRDQREMRDMHHPFQEQIPMREQIPINEKVNTSQHTKLAESVIQEIKRLGGWYSPGKKRTYYGLDYEIPAPIQEFVDTQWPRDAVFEHEKLGISELRFGKEFVITYANEFKFLREHEDAILIANGDVLVAALMKNGQQTWSDFNVYILDDDHKDAFRGPFKLSEFLSGVERTWK